MKSISKSDTLNAAGLLLLSLLPLLGGVRRLTELIGGAALTQENARFFASPLPIALHVVSCSVYFVLGAFQFSARVRQGYPHWHRAAGRLLVAAGLVSAASGMWMAMFYPPLFGSGAAIAAIRLVVGSAMGLFICLGVAAIKQRAFLVHRAWMIRAYALAIAAGTQPFTLGSVYLARGTLDELTYTAGLAAGWVLNIAVAEWIIRRRTIVVARLDSR